MRRRRRLRPRDAVTWRRSATVRPAQRNEPAIVPAIGQEAIEPAMSGAGHQRRANDPDPPRSPPDSTPSGTSTADHQDHPGRRCCRPTNPATGRASPGAGRAVQIGKARRHDVVPLVRIPRTVRRTVDRCHLLHLLCPIVRPGSHRRFHGLNRLGMSPRQAPSQAALPMQRFAWICASTALALHQIRVNGHLGPTLLAAFSALIPQHRGHRNTAHRSPPPSTPPSPNSKSAKSYHVDDQQDPDQGDSGLNGSGPWCGSRRRGSTRGRGR